MTDAEIAVAAFNLGLFAFYWALGVISGALVAKWAYERAIHRELSWMRAERREHFVSKIRAQLGEQSDRRERSRDKRGAA